MVHIPDEIVHDWILLRLHDDGDVFTLFRCAATCKGWRRLLAGSSILRRRWPSSLLGCFARQCHVTWPQGTGPMDAGTPLSFVPTGRSTGIGATSAPFRHISSFIRDAPDSLDSGVPLASRGSLLLLRLVSGDHGSKPNVARFAVCDLLAGTCHVLPELECGRRFAHYANSYGYAILPSRVDGNHRYYSDDDGGQPPPTFRVLILGQDKHNTSYNLHVFAPVKLSPWSTHVKCFNKLEREAWSMMHAEGIVCRSHTHWLFSSMSHFHLLNVEVETGRVTLTKLLSPTPVKRPNVDGNCIENAMLLYLNSLDGISNMDRLTTTANGTLLTLCRYCSEGGRLEMWTRQEADGEQSSCYYVEWLRTRVIELKLFEVSPKLQHPTCVCLGERSGRLLIMDGRRCMYTVDLESGALEEVTDQFKGHVYNRIVPVEFDWP